MTTKIRDISIIALFALLILAPSSILIFGWDKSPTSEGRRLTEFPSLKSWEDIARFPPQFEAYFADHFGLRSRLVTIDASIKLLFRTSPSSKVILGQNGWLFYGGDRMADRVRGRAPMSNNAMERFRRELEAKILWLDELGIRYLYAVAPNKHTIYSDYLPERIVAKSPSRLQALKKHLERRSHASVFDLTATILRAKRDHRVFHKTDTHWNSLGALVATNKLVHILLADPPRPELSLEDASIGYQSVEGGDLARMFSKAGGYREEIPTIRFESEPCIPQPKEAFAATEPKVTRYGCDQENLPERLVFFRDSFGNALLPFLSAYFRNVVHSKSNFSPSLIQELVDNGTTPTHVLELSVERLIEKPVRLQQIHKLIYGLRQSSLSTRGSLSKGSIIITSVPDTKHTANRQLIINAGSPGSYIDFKTPTESAPYQFLRFSVHASNTQSLRLYYRVDEKKFSAVTPYLLDIRPGDNEIVVLLDFGVSASSFRLTFENTDSRTQISEIQLLTSAH